MRRATGANGTARRARKETAGEGHDGRDRWLISYADLVTLLFTLFVVLYAAADRERAQQIVHAIAIELGEAGDASAASARMGNGVLPGADSLAGVNARIKQVFAANTLLGAHARVTENERGVVISLAEAGFFAPGEAKMRDEALALVDDLAVALRESDSPLRIEGHTDSLPIASARYPSNWELSGARASSVLARLIARGIPSTRLSVAGYADERPVADNATPEGRALNRRVDLVILRATEKK